MSTLIPFHVPDAFRRAAPWLGLILVLGTFVLGSIHYARITLPVMDEGTYLIKGRLYLEGVYKPFQDFGPITNKPPLAFQILGLSQVLFEPGLASGRYFAIFLACLMIIGQWFIVRRLCGDIWAFLICALFSLSPAWMIYFMRPMTQGITALFVTWCLFFSLGKARSQYQLALGLFFANLAVLTRSNMIPFMGLFYIYILIENGWNKSILPISVGILTFIGYNALYWPSIYTHIWKYVLPDPINSFFVHLMKVPNNLGDLGTSFLVKEFRLIDKVQVLFDTLRFFFLPFLAASFGSMLSMQKRIWQDKQDYEILFLSLVYFFSTILQFYYIIGEDFTLYSFPSYFAFYLPVGLTLLPLVINKIKNGNYSRLFPWLLSVITPIITAGIGLSLYRDVSGFLMKLKLPSFDPPFKIFFKYEIWDVLLTRFKIDPLTQEFLLPSVAGFVIGVLIVLLVKLLWKWTVKPRYSYGTTLAGFIFVMGYVLSPTYLLAGKDAIRTCPEVDILAAFAERSQEIKTLLPTGSKVYFEGYTPNVLIPLKNLQIFPAQLNMLFYYQNGGNLDDLERFGYWNDELAHRWLREADYILVSPLVAKQRGLIGSSQYTHVMTTGNADMCMEYSPIEIYKKR